MGDEIHVPVTIPLDDDGFLRRECPTCEGQFKWNPDAESDIEADQYFCPLCGVPSSVDSWWTTDQLEYAFGSAGPELDRTIQDAVADAFRGAKGITFTPSSDFSLDIPTPLPLTEPNDMVIVVSPCHPSEPLKVPHSSAGRVHCLICGRAFAA